MRELLVPYEIFPTPERVKSKILLEAARLFALSGYHAVSIRDIALEVGTKPATIHAHFTDKRDILDRIMERCGWELRDFYALLDHLSAEAESFADILGNIFAEPKESTNPFSYYAIWCAMHTQFEFESARRLYYDTYFRDGHIVMRRQLEIAIERGLVLPFDVGEIASLITNSILMMVGFHVGNFHGFYPDFEIPAWYARQIDHILRVTGADR